MAIPVFILAGQSNAAFLSADIEAAFDDRYGEGNYEMLRVFASGAPLTRERFSKEDWSDPRELRQDLTADTIDALNQSDDHVVGGLIWIQGEADTFDPDEASQYGETLDGLIDSFRDDVSAAMGDRASGLDTAPVTILELSNNAPAAPGRDAWTNVIEEQREFAAMDPNAKTLDPDVIASNAQVSADDMFRDGLHYADDFGDFIAEELVETMPPASEFDQESTAAATSLALEAMIPLVEVDPEENAAMEDEESDSDSGDTMGLEWLGLALPLLALTGLAG